MMLFFVNKARRLGNFVKKQLFFFEWRTPSHNPCSGYEIFRKTIIETLQCDESVIVSNNAAVSCYQIMCFIIHREHTRIALKVCSPPNCIHNALPREQPIYSTVTLKPLT